MKSIAKKEILLFLSLSIFNTCQATGAIHFNGEEVLFDTEKKSVSFSITEEQNGISFTIKDDNITVWGENLGGEVIALNTNFYVAINPEGDKIAKVVQEESIYIGVTGVAKCYAAFLKTNDSLKIEGHIGATITMTRSEVENDTIIISPVVNTSNFFLTTNGTVELQAPPSQQTWLESIVFSPSTALETPYSFVFDGTMRLSTPETVIGPFSALGAETITFKLKNI